MFNLLVTNWCHLLGQFKPKQIVFFALFAACTPITHGQTDNQPYTHFSTTDGLVDNVVNDIVKDSDGYVWIATQNGLSRFDGSNFINFNSESHKAFFADNKVESLYKKGKYIYLLSSKYGLLRLDPILFTFQTISKHGIQSFVRHGEYAAYLFTDGSLVIKKKNKQLARKNILTTKDASIAFYDNHLFLSAKKNGLYKIRIKDLHFFQQYAIGSTQDLGKLVASKKYGLLYITSNNTYVIPKHGTAFLHPKIGHIKGINYYVENSDNTSDFLVDYSTPYVNFDPTFTTLVFDKSQNAAIRSICKLNEDCILLGSNQGIVKVSRSKNFRKTFLDNTLIDENAIRVRRKIINDENNNLYLLGYPGITTLDVKNNTFRKLNPREKDYSYDGVLFNSELFYVTEGFGVYSYSPKSKKTKAYVTEHIKENAYFNHISVYSDSVLILGGTGKIVLFDPMRKVSAEYLLPRSAKIFVIKEDPITKNLWAATSNGVYCFRIDDAQITFFALKNESVKSTKDILLLPKRKEIWLASDNGIEVRSLYDFSLLKQYNKPHEISNPKVTSLLAENEQTVWASTYSGLTMFDLAKNEILMLSQKNGLQNTEYNYKSSLKLRDGRIIFGGTNSFDILNPSTIKNSVFVGKLFISALELVQQNKKQFIPFIPTKKNNFQFKTGIEELNIHLANLDFCFGVDYTIEYRINKDRWITLDKNNVIHISNLPYGEHDITIRLLDPFKRIVENKKFKVYAIISFYEKKSFLIILLALVIGLSFLAIFYFKRSILTEKRTKIMIAMDLHDEAGTILTRLLLLSKRKEAAHNERELLQSGLNDALYSIRTFIDTMSKSKFTLLDLQDDIKEFVIDSFVHSDIECEFVDSSNFFNPVLSGELCKDIKLCIYETVNNCLKYSNCSKFSVLFKVEKNMLVIVISDDGVLQSIDQLNSKGNGVRNIKKRTQRNNGTSSFYSNVNNQGLVIELKFPIK